MESFDNKEDEAQSDQVGIRGQWVVVAGSSNRMLAEFAVNGLKSYDIPAVLGSKGGFFGSSGLPLRSLSTGKLDQFEVMVPSEFEEEAKGLVGMFLGDETSGDDATELPEENE